MEFPSRCEKRSLFSDGEWDWDNYSIVVLTQRKDLPTSSMVAAKDNVWCAIGNNIHVIHSQQLRMEVSQVWVCVQCHCFKNRNSQ